MRLVVVGLASLVVIAQAWLDLNSLQQNPFPPAYVLAKVDNFDPNNTETFKQYFYLEGNGDSNVNLLWIGGEGANSLSMDSAGDTPSYPSLVEDLADTFHADVYSLAHRYYDGSFPVPHPNTTEDYKYLTSQQSLADVENFIKFINNGTRNKKWITVGGSYAGMLALWHRQLYPQSTVGTIGSSGPVHAVANFTSFFLVSQNGYKERHPECYTWLKKAFAEFKALLDRKDPKLKTLYPDLSKRYNIEDDHEANLFAYHVVSDAYTQIQRNIDGICEKYNALLPKTTPIQDLARCFGNTADDIEDPRWRAWIYQVCNEFGFFYSPDHSDCFAQGLYDIKKVYGHQCEKLFGSNYTYEKVEKKIQETLDFYKLDKPYPATNAIASNSVYDPWSGQGLKEAASDTVKFFMIRNGTHCHDLRAGNNPDVYASRKVVKQEVARWIREANN